MIKNDTLIPHVPLKLLLIAIGLFLLLLPEISIGKNIILNTHFKKINIGTHIELFEDKDGTLSFSDIITKTNAKKIQWKPSRDKSPGFGFTQSTYWVRFTVKNNSQQTVKWLLNQEYPLIDHFHLFIPRPDGSYKSLLLGDYHIFSNRPISYRSFVVPFNSLPYEEYTVYARYSSTSSLDLSLVLWSPETFAIHKERELPVLWMFYGIFFAMFCFNLIILLYLRDFTYLYYIGYIASFGLLMMSLNGIAFQYLWPTAIWWANICIPILMAFSIVCIAEFARKMINTKKNSPTIDLTLRLFILLCYLLIIITLVSNNYRFGIITGTLLAGITSCLGFIFAAYLAFAKKHKIRESMFYFIAFSIFLVGIFIYVLKTFSLLPTNFFTIYAIQIGALLEIVLLSLVLPDRLNTFKERLTVLNENLEGKVQKRTEELKATQAKLLNTVHKAGMADMARDTIHSIGNIVNSMIVSLELLSETNRSNPLKALKQANNLLRKNINRLDEFICEDPKGKKLMRYYLELDKQFDQDQVKRQNTINRITRKIKEITDVVATQNNYVDKAFFNEIADLKDIIEDVLQLLADDLHASGITIKKEFKDIPTLQIQKPKLIYIFFNLINNAIEAMSGEETKDKKLFLSLFTSNGSVFFQAKDTGVGIAKEEQIKIFRHGYSLRENGRGIGLHSCGNYMYEMGGKIMVESDGLQKGATFTLEFPVG